MSRCPFNQSSKERKKKEKKNIFYQIGKNRKELCFNSANYYHINKNNNGKQLLSKVVQFDNILYMFVYQKISEVGLLFVSSPLFHS
jgi:hypothetical protein